MDAGAGAPGGPPVRGLPTTLHHVTLSTGHWRESPRAEVADQVVATLAPLVRAVARGEEQPVPWVDDPPCVMTGATGGACLVATVWAPPEPDGLGTRRSSRAGGTCFTRGSILSSRTCAGRRQQPHDHPVRCAHLRHGVHPLADATTTGPGASSTQTTPS